ncbi:unnamed protein product [Paramecium sonneborni]|uniref:Uncharacterized protein n=1 Tax=Paramecium sonneborni TaxID=65129 RepID=A0A8S1K9B4_9CILI|nr:unnamed protein product [Paramecium sonneborni]
MSHNKQFKNIIITNYKIIQQSNNVCEKPIKYCQNLSYEYFINLILTQNYDQQVTFKLNGETFYVPFIELYENFKIFCLNIINFKQQ